MTAIHAKAARLHAYLSSRVLQIDYLLARAHGRLAAWYASADRLALPEANVVAIDGLHELSLAVLKARGGLVGVWRAELKPGHEQAVVDGITECHWYHGQFNGDGRPEDTAFLALARATFDEANRALGAWDGPESIIETMKGDQNVS